MSMHVRPVDSLKLYASSIHGRLRGRQRWDTLAVSMALMWGFAIVLDALTTLPMMASGLFEEANPVAERGMNSMGVVPYVVLASLASVAYAVLGLGRPRDMTSWAVCATIAAAGAYKLVVGVSNAVLAVTGWELPLPL